MSAKKRADTQQGISAPFLAINQIPTLALSKSGFKGLGQHPTLSQLSASSPFFIFSTETQPFLSKTQSVHERLIFLSKSL